MRECLNSIDAIFCAVTRNRFDALSDAYSLQKEKLGQLLASVQSQGFPGPSSSALVQFRNDRLHGSDDVGSESGASTGEDSGLENTLRETMESTAAAERKLVHRLANGQAENFYTFDQTTIERVLGTMRRVEQVLNSAGSGGPAASTPAVLCAAASELADARSQLVCTGHPISSKRGVRDPSIRNLLEHSEQVLQQATVARGESRQALNSAQVSAQNALTRAV